MLRHLVIFDLDETLVHATNEKLSHTHDFEFGGYFVYLRPHLNECLRSVAENFDIAIWSSASKEYVEEITSKIILPPLQVKFSWSVERCVQKVDHQKNGYVYIKDLRKIQKYGYTVEAITMVDDSPEKIVRQPRSHLHIEPFMGSSSDNELLSLPNRITLHAQRK